MTKATRRFEGGLPERFLAVLRLPMLARDVEHALALRARAGDAEARQQLVRHGLGLVIAIVRRYGLSGVRLEEAVQEGSLGLLRSLDTFDPDAGTRFATYATWWVRAFVGKYAKESRSVVRPRGGSFASTDVSLDCPVNDDDDTTFLDRVEDGRAGPEQALLAGEEGQEVRDAVERLRRRIGPLGLDIIASRLQREDPEPLEMIGERWGLSRERIRQVELKTKALLAGILGDRAAA